jgi:hypothetical protein
MPEMSEAKRQYWRRWSNRVLIIMLGLSLGLGARWIKQTWQGKSVAEPQNGAVEKPASGEK